jgi:hypothetical protein
MIFGIIGIMTNVPDSGRMTQTQAMPLHHDIAN